VGEVGQAAGAASGVPAEGVKPGEDGTPLDSPVLLPEVLAGITVAADAADAARLLENLERRAADQRLRDELAANDFDGPGWRRFQEELARYGIAVLRAWMHSGFVFKLASARGLRLYPTELELEELYRDSDVRQELADMTVAVALHRFRERALVGGEWRFEGGASLATFFMGTCLYAFPNEFRRRRVEREKWRRQDRVDPAVAAQDALPDPASDPAVIVPGNLRVCQRLRAADPRAAAILALTIDDYQQDEIAEVLGEPSVRAVEGVLYRWRVTEKQRMRGRGAAS
jgi:hypothetical protein